MKKINLIWLLVLSFNISYAEVITTPQQAIYSYWGVKARIKEKTFIVTEGISTKILKQYQVKIKPQIIKYFEVFDKEVKKGDAVLYSDKVRTKFMTTLMFISKDNLIATEVISFAEPNDYRPKKGWIKYNYTTKNLDTLAKAVNSASISGATLTAASMQRTVRTISSIWSHLVSLK